MNHVIQHQWNLLGGVDLFTLLINYLMCVAVVTFSLAIYFYVLLLLLLFIVQSRFSTPNKFYNDDDVLLLVL